MRLRDRKLTTRKWGTCWPPGPLLTPPGTDLHLHPSTLHHHLSPNPPPGPLGSGAASPCRPLCPSHCAHTHVPACRSMHALTPKLMNPQVRTGTHACPLTLRCMSHPRAPHSLRSARACRWVTLVSRCAIKFTIRLKAERRDEQGGAKSHFNYLWQDPIFQVIIILIKNSVISSGGWRKALPAQPAGDAEWAECSENETRLPNSLLQACPKVILWDVLEMAGEDSELRNRKPRTTLPGGPT